MKANIIYEGVLKTQLPFLEEGDFGFDIIFEVNTDNNSVVDISSYTTITFKAAYLNDFDGNLISKVCTLVSDGTDGRCKLTIEDGDLSDFGSFDCQLELVSATEQRSVKLGYLNIYKNV